MVIEEKKLFSLYAKDDETEDDVIDVTEAEDEKEDAEEDSEVANFEI